MADEILNKLGFDVTQALAALKSLDTGLQNSGTQLQNHATQLSTWNTSAKTALDTMRQLATASASIKTPSTPHAAAPVPTPAAATTSKLWLPQGLKSDIDKATQSMAKLGTTSSTAGHQMVNAGTTSANAVKKATNDVKRLTISWQMVVRVVQTQLIVRALSAIRNMLRQVVSDSIDFQKSLAEIQAITPKIHGDFKSLGVEAANVSKKFNIPLPQASEAIYQSISNQFVTIADRTRILEAATKLARVGVMSLDDAVLLLTGTLNAYGVGSENAEVIAAKFFKTIQLGRIRGKELADTIGTVIPFAAQLGVNLDEVTASYVSMTIGGLESHKAATGLRQVMVQLLKPSEDLARVFREMGYANAEQLVQALGLPGALQAISDAANNMGSEVVKSVRNVRALTAQLSLTREDSEEVTKALEAMGSVGGDSLQALYEEFIDNPAEKLTKQINALTVTLTEDLGSAMVNALASVMDFMGGADRMSAALQSLVVVLGIAGTAAIGLAAAFAILHVAAGPIGWLLLGVSAALTTLIGVSTYQSIRAIQEIKAVADARRQSALKQIKDVEEALRATAEAEDKAMRESIKVWEKKAAVIRKVFFRAMDELRIRNTRLVEDTRTTLAAMVGAQSSVVSVYKNAAKAAADAIQQSKERQIDGEAAYSDAVYKYAHKNEGAHARAEAYMRRARHLANEAADAMRHATTPEQISSALSAFQRADAAAKEAEQIANGTSNLSLQGDAQRQVLHLMRQKIEAEKALQRLQAEEAKRLTQKTAKERARLDRMKVLMKSILGDLRAFDKAGAKDPKDLKDQEDRLRANIGAFRGEWLGGQKIDVADLMAFDQLERRVSQAVEGGLTDLRINKLYATGDTFEKLRLDIEKGVGPVRLLLEVATRFDPKLKQAMEGMTGEESMSLLSEELGRSADSLNSYRTEVSNKLTVAREGLKQFAKLSAESLGKWVKDFSPEDARFLEDKLFQLNFPEKFKERANALNGFFESALKFTKPDIELDEEAFAELNAAYKEYLEQIKPSPEGKATLDQFITDARLLASQAAGAQAALKIQDKSFQKAVQSEQRIKDIKAALEAALKAAQEAKQSTDGASRSAGSAYTKSAAVASIDMSSFTTQTQQAAAAMWNLANASTSVKTPQAPNVRSLRNEIDSIGGRAGRYLAAGGPVGTDTLPAWLTRGEVVMNTGAANKFASQLVAMNAGVQPTFRSNGGGVTNIGDINVSVKGGDTSRQTVRDIATELRRELRRGTTTL